jgi:hypothetical protein
MAAALKEVGFEVIVETNVNKRALEIDLADTHPLLRRCYSAVRRTLRMTLTTERWSA